MSEIADFPDCSVEEAQLFKLNAIMTTIVAYESEIRNNGMSKAVGVGLESADPGILGTINVNMLTELGSNTKLGVGLEAIEWRKIGLAFTGVGIILGMLIKVYQWIRDRWQGSGSSSAIAAKQKQVADIKKDMADVKKELEARLKKHHETPVAEQTFMNLFPDDENPFFMPFKLNLVEHLRSKKITMKQALMAMTRIQTISKMYNLYDSAQIGSLILYQATKDIGTKVDMSWVVFCDKLRYNPAALGPRRHNGRQEIDTIFNGITMHYVQGMLSVMRAVVTELRVFVDINNRRMQDNSPIIDQERINIYRHTEQMLDRFHKLILDAGYMADNPIFDTEYKDGVTNPVVHKAIKERYHAPTCTTSEYMDLFPAIVKELGDGLCVLNPRVENAANEDEWIATLTLRLTPLQHVLSKFDLDDVIRNHRAVFSSATDAMIKADADEILKACVDLKKDMEHFEAEAKKGKDMLFTNEIEHPKYRTLTAGQNVESGRIEYPYLLNTWLHYVSAVTSTLQKYYGTGTRAEQGLFRLHELMKKHK